MRYLGQGVYAERTHSIENTFYREHSIYRRMKYLGQSVYAERTHSIENTFYREKSVQDICCREHILQRTHSIHLRG